MSIAKKEEEWGTLQDYFRSAGVANVFPAAQDIVLKRFDDELEKLVPMTPFKHQVSGLGMALGVERFGLFDDPGCGKTVISQAYSMYQALLGNKSIIVMPPTLLEQFVESIELNFSGYERHFSLTVLDQGPAKRLSLVRQWDKESSWPDMLLMSYQIFSAVVSPQKSNKAIFKINSDLKAMEKSLGIRLQRGAPLGDIEDNIEKRKKRKEVLLNDLEVVRKIKEGGYNVLVADEAHTLRNPTSGMSRSVKHFMGEEEGEAAVLLMTGTPVFNTLLDAYGLIKIMNPKRYVNKKAFERLYCIKAYVNDELRIVGFDHIDEIYENLYRTGRRVIKSEVFDMKTPQVIQVPIKLSPGHKALYKKLVSQRFLEVDGEIIDALQAQSLRQKCLRIVTTPELFSDSPIVNNVHATLDTLMASLGVSIEGNEKVIIFAHYRESIKLISEWFKHLNPVLIYGANRSKHEDSKNSFLKDKSCKLLISNPLSGGVGLNLQSVCRYVIFAEPTSVPGEFKQASERVHRAGQKLQVSVYILKALGTLSPSLTANMLRKERDALAVNRDKESLLKEFLGL